MKTKQDRQKAAKLRKKKGPLTAEQRLWLTAYDASKSASAKNSTRGVIPTAWAKAKAATKPAPPKPAAAPAVLPPREQLSMPFVQETKPPEGSIDPSSHTWVATMPEAPADAEPAPAGTPEQPKVGTPLVGDPAAPATPLGDPHAAAQFAGIVKFITYVGFTNALELSATMPIPAEVRAFATGDNISAAIQFVGESAERLALKYGFTGVPLADEAIVVGAVAMSALAIRTNMKRKAEIAAAAPKQVTAQPAAASSPTEAPHPSGGINDLWASQLPVRRSEGTP